MPITPERELLKLIEGQEKEKKGSGTFAIHSGLSFLSPSAWLGRLSFFKKKIRQSWIKPGLPYLFDLKKLNVFLFL